MKLGIHEERTRIFLYLPYNNPAEAKAVGEVIGYLKSKRKTPQGKGRITGYTQTRSLPTVVEGFWWSKKKKKWVHDNLILLIIDHEFKITDTRLHTEVDDFKKIIAQFYSQEGSQQEEIWVATHGVWRYD